MTNITLRRAPWRAPITSLLGRDFFDPTIGRMFDLGAQSPLGAEAVGLTPAVEIAESPTEFTCTAELPGLAEKDVEVGFDANELTIKGEKRDERESKKDGKRYHVWERSYGSFERVFTFPAQVDASKVAAEFKHGVLTVHLPKATNGQPKARVIPVVTK